MRGSGEIREVVVQARDDEGRDHRSKAGGRNKKPHSGIDLFKSQNTQWIPVTPHAFQVKPKMLFLKREWHTVKYSTYISLLD